MVFPLLEFVHDGRLKQPVSGVHLRQIVEDSPDRRRVDFKGSLLFDVPGEFVQIGLIVAHQHVQLVVDPPPVRLNVQSVADFVSLLESLPVSVKSTDNFEASVEHFWSVLF